MRHKSLLIAPLIITSLLFLMGCNNSGNNKEINEGTATINSETPAINDTPPTPPPYPDSSKVKVMEAEKKCFNSQGLKYTTTINLSMGEKDFVGTITSEEIGSGNKETARFSGLFSGEGMIVKFKGKPPVIGDASEWTDNVWTIKKSGKKETLTVIFNAKNYETNKWQLTDYQFEQVDCN